MMSEINKGKSPFYPGQPVPLELFTGRSEQIGRIVERGIKQVALGKPVALFLRGEYGIGKSSIANVVQWLAEDKHGLHGIYTSLGGAKDLEDVAEAILDSTLRSGAYNPSITDKLRDGFARFFGKQSLFGVNLDFEVLRSEAPKLASHFGILEFLSDIKRRLESDGVKGIFLILDEINGITRNERFAHFIKGIVDRNALSKTPLPLLLLLCGVEERQREMIRVHQPVDRIFDVVEIGPMSTDEMRTFFQRAFSSVRMTIEEKAMELMVRYSAGFPKIMHMIGDAIYWVDKDGNVDIEDALDAIFMAADEVGKKYVDHQVYSALRSDDYHSILRKIVKSPSSPSFLKADVTADLTDTEKRKFNNFLQKMKKLNVLRSGIEPGEYVFNMRMVQLYIFLKSREKTKSR